MVLDVCELCGVELEGDNICGAGNEAEPEEKLCWECYNYICRQNETERYGGEWDE